MPMTTEDAKRALDVKLGPNDADAETVRDYFKMLLLNLLVLEESFSGKRPFGNSGWTHEILAPLEAAGFDVSNEDALFGALVDAL